MGPLGRVLLALELVDEREVHVIALLDNMAQGIHDLGHDVGTAADAANAERPHSALVEVGSHIVDPPTLTRWPHRLKTGVHGLLQAVWGNRGQIDAVALAFVHALLLAGLAANACMLRC
eukprot:28683-Lingulodinium_polyedra.AAC.1